MVSPGREGSRPGLSSNSAKGPVSRILSCAVIPLGAALPRTLISDLPGGFGVLRTAASCRAKVPADRSEPPERVGPMRSGAWLLARASLPIWSCSVWGLPCPRRYRRSGALLPHHFTLTPALEFPQRRAYPASRPTRVLRFQGGPPEGGVAEAVSFLWHWPSTGLEARVPDVIRHTALRSSDFPPPADRACARPPAATARSSCQFSVYLIPGFTSCGRVFGRQRVASSSIPFGLTSLSRIPLRRSLFHRHSSNKKDGQKHLCAPMLKH